MGVRGRVCGRGLGMGTHVEVGRGKDGRAPDGILDARVSRLDLSGRDLPGDLSPVFAAIEGAAGPLHVP